jgi:hypothetical protein
VEHQPAEQEYHQHQHQQPLENDHELHALNSNVDVLRIENLTESRNFTCRAHNTYGLVVFNLSLVIKGNFLSTTSSFLYV